MIQFPKTFRQEFFWTDSQVVLGYIGNEVKRFHVFVANQVQQIHEGSSLDQWLYVDTKSNPADEGSRGLRPSQLTKSDWINGPNFLWQEIADWKETTREVPALAENDPELKGVISLATTISSSFPSLLERLSYFSDWERAKKALAMCLRYLRCLKAKIGTKTRYDLRRNSKFPRQVNVKPISVEELREAEFDPQRSPTRSGIRYFSSKCYCEARSLQGRQQNYSSRRLTSAGEPNRTVYPPCYSTTEKSLYQPACETLS